MTSLELLKEIEAWLSFNTEPSKEETVKLRKSINDHVIEQLNLLPVSGSLYQDGWNDCLEANGLRDSGVEFDD